MNAAVSTGVAWIVKEKFLTNGVGVRAVSFSVDGEMRRGGDGAMGRWGDRGNPQNDEFLSFSVIPPIPLLPLSPHHLTFLVRMKQPWGWGEQRCTGLVL
ncbi:MAG: hypothetical protein EAZ09_12360 [Oscillatoriales cyanobacterium]|nr:MAG: hypothetical protein EAZ09_12360 [Oscillatoriales cyanobacterium]